ncbi:MAG: hypothetical protein H6739_07255 [Alphaproteobacteria bacterium]|nr:hypothetical protein [Alphaproteobacteria bacterium]MCB9759623.1 hypothetical protein [Alphaproteobacteria bacterium]
MKLDPTTAWLLGVGPDPGPEARSELEEAAPPPELLAQTLAAVEVERAAERAAVEAPAPANTRPRRAWLIAGLAAAAAVVAVIRAPDPVGDPDQMVARGLEESAPVVALKVATRHAGRLERLREGAAYAPGDQLYFRYQLGTDGWVHLVTATDGRVEVLVQRAMPAGEADLLEDGQPLAWTIEPGDPSAAFALISTSGPLPGAALSEALQTGLGAGQTEGAEGLCEAARRAGFGCDAIWLEVTP